MSGKHYYRQSLNVDVYPGLEMAVADLPRILPKIAVDAGSGSGRDSLFLVNRGFTVHAYDKSEEAISCLREAGQEHLGETLFTHICSFDRFEYPRSSLISACSSLFFCPPDAFPGAWRKITQSLLDGGIFCGHFMGPDDSWAGMPRDDLTIHTRNEVEGLFNHDFKLIDIHERNSEGMTLLGKKKHWHIYSVVAQKDV